MNPATGSGAADRSPATARHWGAVAGLAVMLALLIGLVLLPNALIRATPENEPSMTEALFSSGDVVDRPVTLPMAWKPAHVHDTAVFQLSFQNEGLDDGPKVLFIPAVRRKVEVRLNGIPLDPMGADYWTDPRNGHYYLARLPDELIQPGTNWVEIRQGGRDGWFAGYLSQVHLVPKASIASDLWLRDFISEQWRLVSFALLVVLAVALSVLVVLRRRDPVSNWLSLLLGSSLLVVISRKSDVVALNDVLLLASVALQLSTAASALGLALALGRRPRPRWLRLGLVLLPPTVLGLGLSGAFSPRAISLSASAGSLMLLAAAILCLIEGFSRDRDWLKGLMFLTFGLAIFSGFHDVALVTGRIEGPFMLLPFTRLLGLASVMAILTGWLAQSLNLLDASNVTLTRRLREREAELGSLYQREQERARLSTLAQERERLMQDLHDGLSGHLVSIIALSERPAATPGTIELSAREALDDLRLVVQSLDIGEGDLGAALAGFRERLHPRLRRLGVQLDWSGEALPDIGGVSPGTALAILRILQEAVTNALHHGPATRIAITATARARGGALIVLRNDGRSDPAPEGKGKGLFNMKRRARMLGGTVTLIRTADGGAELHLELPAVLAGPSPAANGARF